MMHAAKRQQFRLKLLLRQNRGVYIMAARCKLPDRICPDKARRAGYQYLHAVVLLIFRSAVRCGFSP